MAAKNKSDIITYLIGIVIIGIVLFKVIAFILPDRAPEYTGNEFLEKLTNKSSWDSITTMKYKKSYQLYNEDGSIEKDRIENHHYNFKKEMDKQISWTEDTVTHKIQQTRAFLVKYTDNIIDQTAPMPELKSTIEAAAFVIRLPYTLDSQKTQLEYKGLTNFQDADYLTLQVTFEDSWDTWIFYYEQETLAWKGYWVHTSDHYSLVINDEMTTVNGFTLPRKRTSYRTDSIQNITYKRASYYYEDYKIETN